MTSKIRRYILLNNTCMEPHLNQLLIKSTSDNVKTTTESLGNLKKINSLNSIFIYLHLKFKFILVDQFINKIIPTYIFNVRLFLQSFDVFFFFLLCKTMIIWMPSYRILRLLNAKQEIIGQIYRAKRPVLSLQIF